MRTIYQAKDLILSNKGKSVIIKVKGIRNKNEIICVNTYKPSDDVEFPCVVIAYCFDFVEVPKDIYNKLNK